MKWAFFTVILVGFAHCGSATPAPRADLSPEPSGPAIEFSQNLEPFALVGGGNVKAELVPLEVQDGERPQVLLRISGVEHPLSGVTFRAHRDVRSNGAVNWSVQLDGRSFGLLTEWDQLGEGTSLYLPNSLGRVVLKADAFMSGAIRRDVLLADHQRRLADGSLAELERFHRDATVKLKTRILGESLGKLNDTCVGKIRVAMDWASVPDEEIRETSHCNAVLRALTEICNRDLASRRAVNREVKEVQCRRSNESTLRLADSGVLQSGEVLAETGYHAAPKLKKATIARLHEILKLTETVLRSSGGVVAVLHQDNRKFRLLAGREGKLYEQHDHTVQTDRRAVWDGGKDVRLKREELGKWTANCSGGTVEFLETDDAFRRDVLANYTREARPWKTVAFALSRDDRGIYYYVDRLTPQNGGKGFRVFKGPRGAAKLTSLVDIVDDSDGMIFATTKGKLRLILERDRTVSQARWIEGKKEHGLTSLSLSKNRAFIYKELGVYAKVPLGTICDL